MGFYSDGALQREVPKILERIDPVPWTPEEIERRRRSGSSRDKRIADVIKASRGLGWTDNEYQLFLLTQQDERGRRDGHVTLSSELANQRTGRGSAWARRQRYVAVVHTGNSIVRARDCRGPSARTWSLFQRIGSPF